MKTVGIILVVPFVAIVLVVLLGFIAVLIFAAAADTAKSIKDGWANGNILERIGIVCFVSALIGMAILAFTC